MSAQPDPFSDHDAALETLLSCARWPEMPPAAMARLRASVRRRKTRWWIGPASLAAAAITVMVWIGVERFARRSVAPAPPAAAQSPRPSPREPEARAWVRSSTPAERLRVTPVRQPGGIAANVAVADVLSRLRAGTSPNDLAVTLRKVGDHPFVWRRLESEIARDPARAPQLAAVLARIAAPTRIDALMELYRVETCRDAILPRLVQWADSGQLSRLLDFDSDLSRRKQLAAAIVARDVTGALTIGLVVNSRTRVVALAALRESNVVPTASLFAALSDPWPQHRLAAARALGTLRQPDVLPTLEQMVITSDRRREALTALLYCRDAQADEIVKRLSQDRSIGALVRVVASEIDGSI